MLAQLHSSLLHPLLLLQRLLKALGLQLLQLLLMHTMLHSVGRCGPHARTPYVNCLIRALGPRRRHNTMSQICKARPGLCFASEEVTG